MRCLERMNIARLVEERSKMANQCRRSRMWAFGEVDGGLPEDCPDFRVAVADRARDIKSFAVVRYGVG